MGDIYGIDNTDIQGKLHLVCVDYKSCCIFEWQLNNLQMSEAIKALKSIFCYVGVPDKVVSDNARYFTSEEFEESVMTWSIQHIMSSPWFPHGNTHAEKAVHIVKQIYAKASDVKFARLLLKTMPIANKGSIVHEGPGNVFFGRQLKAHLPVFQCQKSLNTCIDNDKCASIELLSKYSKGQSVWIKLDQT